jgi:hypothetical protein
MKSALCVGCHIFTDVIKPIGDVEFFIVGGWIGQRVICADVD